MTKKLHIGSVKMRWKVLEEVKYDIKKKRRCLLV